MCKHLLPLDVGDELLLSVRVVRELTFLMPEALSGVFNIHWRSPVICSIVLRVVTGLLPSVVQPTAFSKPFLS